MAAQAASATTRNLPAAKGWRRAARNAGAYSLLAGFHGASMALITLRHRGHFYRSVLHPGSVTTGGANARLSTRCALTNKISPGEFT